MGSETMDSRPQGETEATRAAAAAAAAAGPAAAESGLSGSRGAIPGEGGYRGGLGGVSWATGVKSPLDGVDRWMSQGVDGEVGVRPAPPGLIRHATLVFCPLSAQCEPQVRVSATQCQCGSQVRVFCPLRAQCESQVRVGATIRLERQCEIPGMPPFPA